MILKSHDCFLWFFVILVIFSDLFVWFFGNFSLICDFYAFCMWFLLWFCDFCCDFVIFVCDFFVISRKVYEKKSVICPSGNKGDVLGFQGTWGHRFPWGASVQWNLHITDTCGTDVVVRCEEVVIFLTLYFETKICIRCSEVSVYRGVR